MPQHVSLNTLAALRERLLAGEEFTAHLMDNVAEADVAVAAVQPVASGGLDPSQLQQIQELIDEYTDQIS